MSRHFRSGPIFLAIFACALQAHAGPRARTALRDAVEVRRDVVFLADLLPASAPPALLSATLAISLGYAPNPGAQRTFDHAEIERALRDAPGLSEALEIPAAVEVTRWSRQLTGAEVIAAIRRAMILNHFGGAASVELEELAFDAPIRVTEDNPSLRVTRIETAPDGAATHVRLWTASEPRIPPFWVTLRRQLDSLAPPCSSGPACDQRTPGSSAEIAGAPQNSGVRPAAANTRKAAPGLPPGRAGATSARATPSDPAVLVQRGKRVQLIVEVNGMRIMASAVPLDLGRQGEKIRVRNVDSGKILVGTVVSAQTVEVQF
ncbi:MAG TPA: flagellar basal body P-ring formation chaperone FlgA [Candidatus Sulfotelmatobacter sp.]|nr:flagellar basal body P-ring formation chaperone FlgA [Candidatus Sulfotelmatobacter sp.]